MILKDYNRRNKILRKYRNIKIILCRAFQLKYKNDLNMTNFFFKDTLKRLTLYNVISLPKYKNSCLYSKKSRSISRYFRMSRWRIKEYTSKGYLNGINKSSW